MHVLKSVIFKVNDVFIYNELNRPFFFSKIEQWFNLNKTKTNKQKQKKTMQMYIIIQDDTYIC